MAMEKDSNLFTRHLNSEEEDYTSRESINDILEREHRLAFERSKLIEDMKFRRDYKEPFKDKPTRFEVIDKTGRVYVNNNCEFELSWQDNNRTLKIFIK